MKQKFKVGDRVRYKADDEIGTVQDFKQGLYAVHWDDGPWTGERCVWWSEGELELAQKEEPQEAMVVGVSSIVTPRSSWAGELTLRDQFAMAALAGIMSSNDRYAVPQAVAERVYRAADAMLETRKQHS